MPVNKPSIVIVSPALADSNNGNWQTARRWQQFLQDDFLVRVVKGWPTEQGNPKDALMIALHARRSAEAIQNWHQFQIRKLGHTARSKGLIVALTGTDLYRDIHNDESAQLSLALADSLIVLQSKARDAVPAEYREKTRVIYQSTTTRKPVAKTERWVRAVMVGHLREEKMPETLMQAADLLKGQGRIYLDHIGLPLDPHYEQLAHTTMAQCPNYRWLGGLPHDHTRKRIQRAHVLVHCSKMEGGAHVIMEAVCSGTPVLASKMDGNVGMLGEQYPGYFEVGRADQLADLLRRCEDSRFLEELNQACQNRAPLFQPQSEKANLLDVVRAHWPSR